jgi:hypothetical protein
LAPRVFHILRVPDLRRAVSVNYLPSNRTIAREWGTSTPL